MKLHTLSSARGAPLTVPLFLPPPTADFAHPFASHSFHSMRKAKACHSRDPTTRAAAAQRARQGIAQRHNQQDGPSVHKRLAPGSRQSAKAISAREGMLAIARLNPALPEHLHDDKKRVYTRLMMSNGAFDNPSLLAHDAARRALTRTKRAEYVAAWGRARNPISELGVVTTPQLCRFRRAGNLSVVLPAQDSGGEQRVIDVKKIVCTCALGDSESKNLKKIDVSAYFLGLTNSRRSRGPHLPRKTMCGVLPSECWSPDLLGSANTLLEADDSFALYVEVEDGAEPRFVCCVLRAVLSRRSRVAVDTAAMQATAGNPREWYEWMKGCGASGIPTRKMLVDLMQPSSRKAALYFGSGLRTLHALLCQLHVRHVVYYV